MEDRIRALIVELNNLNIGEFDKLVARIDKVHLALVGLGQPELAARLAEGRACLTRGDVAAFRKTIQNVVSKLGHVRA